MACWCLKVVLIGHLGPRPAFVVLFLSPCAILQEPSGVVSPLLFPPPTPAALSVLDPCAAASALPCPTPFPWRGSAICSGFYVTPVRRRGWWGAMERWDRL